METGAGTRSRRTAWKKEQRPSVTGFKTAQLAGLNAYTVREYKRKYAAGDNSWAYRGGITV